MLNLYNELNYAHGKITRGLIERVLKEIDDDSLSVMLANDHETVTQAQALFDDLNNEVLTDGNLQRQA